jgi:hypothetical protein
MLLFGSTGPDTARSRRHRDRVGCDHPWRRVPGRCARSLVHCPGWPKGNGATEADTKQQRLRAVAGAFGSHAPELAGRMWPPFVERSARAAHQPVAPCQRATMQRATKAASVFARGCRYFRVSRAGRTRAWSAGASSPRPICCQPPGLPSLCVVPAPESWVRACSRTGLSRPRKPRMFRGRWPQAGQRVLRSPADDGPPFRVATRIARASSGIGRAALSARTVVLGTASKRRCRFTAGMMSSLRPYVRGAVSRPWGESIQD